LLLEKDRTISDMERKLIPSKSLTEENTRLKKKLATTYEESRRTKDELTKLKGNFLRTQEDSVRSCVEISDYGMSNTLPAPIMSEKRVRDEVQIDYEEELTILRNVATLHHSNR